MNEEYSLTGLIKMIFLILIISIVFYGLTIIITKNKKIEDDIIKDETQIQYNEILIGNIYDQNEDEYYVLVELNSDYLTLNNVITNYNQKTNKIKLYTADLNNTFNKSYYGTESNFDLQYPIFNKSTLIKIKDKKLVEYVEGTDKITEKLG